MRLAAQRKENPPIDDTFNYLAVLFSIILGLAFAEILQGFRRLLLGRKRVTLYAPPVRWGITLVMVISQTWWAMFSLREHRVWTFATYGIVLTQTIVLYLLAAIALPDSDERGPIDMRRFYYEHAPPFVLLICVAAIISISKDVVIDHRLPGTVNLGFQLAFAASAAFAGLTQRSWYHQLLAPTIAGAFLAYIVQLFSRI